MPQIVSKEPPEAGFLKRLYDLGKSIRKMFNICDVILLGTVICFVGTFLSRFKGYISMGIFQCVRRYGVRVRVCVCVCVCV